tara:strand:- start:1903 stop:2256 length:354 start_codon:yes stop_codon:yes gene_type:complete
MNNLIKIFKFFILINLLSSCQFLKDYKLPETFNNTEKDAKSQKNNNKTLEIRISCGDGNLNEFLEEGWKVKKQYSEEKVCSWKSVPANKKCDIDRDKGCKITKPDVIGKETYYLLER